MPRTTKRIHFFSSEFDKSTFEGILQSGHIDNDQIEKLGYLGFALIKPVNDSHEKPLIGRSILGAPHAADSTHHFVKVHHRVSLFGMGLGTEGIPFQAQDGAVSACATIALWTATHPLAELLGLQRYSPAEITSKISFFPSEQRVFPNDGLSLIQMLTFVRSSNPDLDVEVINVENQATDDLFLIAVKAYVNANLPLIATLELKTEEGRSDYHANVIVGYECDVNGKILKLHVHDDQFSPYSVATPGARGNFKTLTSPWIEEGYTEVVVQKLLVPVYNKIRVNFVRASTFYLNFLRRPQATEIGIRADLYLTTVQAYKANLLNQNIEKQI